MKGRYDMDDPEFGAMWRTFVADEARVQAPGRLGPAVMAAWDAAHAQPLGVRSLRRRRVPVVVLLAAAALLLGFGLAVRYRSGGESGVPGRNASGRGSAVTGRISMSASLPGTPSATPGVGPGVLREGPQETLAQPVRRAIRRDRPALPAVSSSVAAARPTVAGPIVTLAADRAFEAEVLHIMRVRVPHEALQAFGVPFLEPEASRLVDVDVLVGDDGLARDIRRIRPVADADARDYNR